MQTEKPQKNFLKIGIVGTLIAALCCATPIMVLLLGAIGLGAASAYLDYVLLPTLALFFIVTIYGLAQFWKARRS